MEVLCDEGAYYDEVIMCIKKWVAKQWESNDAINLRFLVFFMIISVPFSLFWATFISSTGVLNFLAAFGVVYLLCLIFMGIMKCVDWFYEN